VKVSERALFDEVESGGVVYLGFARETGDYVRTDGRVRKLLVDEFDTA
jgi:hypothetical protein